MMGEPGATRYGSPVNPPGGVRTAIQTLPTSDGGQRPLGTL